MSGNLRFRAAVFVMTGWFCAAAPAFAQLTPEAARGFERYVQLTEQRMSAEVRPGAPFLQVDGLPEAQRQSVLAQLERGEVVSQQLTTPAPTAEIATPGALIHHWVGTVFIPGATLRQVLALVQDYDHQHLYYQPEVERSKLLARSGDDFKIYLRLKQIDVITVVLDTEYDVHYEQLDANRAESHSYSTRIAEIARPGEAGERALPASDDHGFLWRINSYWRFEETRRGVFVQCEAISLTRDIPVGLGWLIAPLIEHVPRESLEFTLEATRKAVLNRASPASPRQDAGLRSGDNT
ncbi:MAG: hypothetical protein ACLP1Y_15955 [Candidatus Acidiferrales bacterium]